jgi:hypothetical protein
VEAAVGVRGGEFAADESQVPWFGGVSRGGGVPLLVADDEAVPPGVRDDPLGLRGAAEAVVVAASGIARDHVDRESGLVLAVAGAGAAEVGRGLAPVGDMAVVGLDLEVIGAEAAADTDRAGAGGANVRRELVERGGGLVEQPPARDDARDLRSRLRRGPVIDRFERVALVRNDPDATRLVEIDAGRLARGDGSSERLATPEGGDHVGVGTLRERRDHGIRLADRRGRFCGVGGRRGGHGNG